MAVFQQSSDERGMPDSTPLQLSDECWSPLAKELWDRLPGWHEEDVAPDPHFHGMALPLLQMRGGVAR